jgi:hypothetical protein
MCLWKSTYVKSGFSSSGSVCCFADVFESSELAKFTRDSDKDACANLLGSNFEGAGLDVAGLEDISVALKDLLFDISMLTFPPPLGLF